MTDLSQMSDDDLLAAYQEAKAGGKQGAMADRQAYVASYKQLLDDQAAYKRVAPLRQQYQRFLELNTKTPTGGGVHMGWPSDWFNTVPGVNGALANMSGGGKSEMATLGANMQVRDVPKGQGQISNFERQLFALGQPGIDKVGGVNEDIVHGALGLFNQEGDRLAFMQDYLSKHRSLTGAQEAWDHYLGANPYVTTQPVDHADASHYGFPTSGRVVPNPRQQHWRDFFSPPPSAEGTSPSSAGALHIRRYNPKTGRIE